MKIEAKNICMGKKRLKNHSHEYIHTPDVAIMQSYILNMSPRPYIELNVNDLFNSILYSLVHFGSMLFNDVKERARNRSHL